MRRKFELSSDGGDYGSKKCKWGYSGTYDGIRRSLRLLAIWSMESGGRFCVVAFGKKTVSVAVKMFSHLIWWSCRWGETMSLTATTQVIYQYGEQWWNDIDRGKLLIRPRYLCWQPFQQSSCSKSGGTGEVNYRFLPHEVSLSCFEGLFNIT
jgi:hypothetical protein